MLEGKCPKCGARYFGWALRWPRHQTCSRCGNALEITEDGEKAYTGYSPFTAEEYTVIPPPGATSTRKEKESRLKEE
jgi:ribosomal protein S27AE